MDFNALFKSKLVARQSTLNAAGTNPPRPISRSDAASEGESVAPSDPPTVSGNLRRNQRKRGSDQEAADQASSTRSKRVREDEASNVDRRPPTPSPNTNEAPPTTGGNTDETSSQRRGAETSGRVPSSRQVSWLQEGFHLLVTQRGLVDLTQELKTLALPMLGLCLSDPRIRRFLGVGPTYRCADPDTIQSLNKSGAEDTMGEVGAHVAQVFGLLYILHCFYLFIYSLLRRRLLMRSA